MTWLSDDPGEKVIECRGIKDKIKWKKWVKHSLLMTGHFD